LAWHLWFSLRTTSACGAVESVRYRIRIAARCLPRHTASTPPPGTSRPLAPSLNKTVAIGPPSTELRDSPVPVAQAARLLTLRPDRANTPASTRARFLPAYLCDILNVAPPFANTRACACTAARHRSLMGSASTSGRDRPGRWPHLQNAATRSRRLPLSIPRRTAAKLSRCTRMVCR